MPWTPADAESHTRRAGHGAAARQWAHVANGVRDRLLAQGMDPKEAAAGTVRKLFAESKERNAIHASDSDENAKRGNRIIRLRDGWMEKVSSG